MEHGHTISETAYRHVGEELARKELHPAAYAKALAEARGDRALAQSLYVRFRAEELTILEAQEAVRLREQKRKREEEDRTHGIYTCPACKHRGRLAIEKHRVRYDKGVCSKCGYVLVPQLRD